MMLLNIFSQESDTVTGLSFHPERPWIVSSLVSGMIQIWDYGNGTLVDQFEGHYGPVRSVHFHIYRPLLVSGGDDRNIKVWSYDVHKCLFTLRGHWDIVNTVQFHHEFPWIVSASNDHTIRIWNWVSRNCVAVLNGHFNAVKSASFHPREDLIVSASLDATVRVWDIGGLKDKSFCPVNYIHQLSKVFRGHGAHLKHELWGHIAGVVFATFHPTLPLIFSASDEKCIFMWKMGDQCPCPLPSGTSTKTWQPAMLGMHTGGVSCAVFHARMNAIVSTSGDNSFCVWDVSSKKQGHCIYHKYKNPRVIASHPTKNLLAVGHTDGMTVFKLKRESPAFSVIQNSLYYIKDHFLCFYKYSAVACTIPMFPIGGAGSTCLCQCATTLSHSPQGNAVLVCSEGDGGTYELHMFSKGNAGVGNAVHVTKRGVGQSAVFMTQNTFAVLEKSNNNLLIKNLENEILSSIILPVVVDALFYAGGRNLLCQAGDSVVMFDLEQRIVIGGLQTSFLKYVVWANDMESVALVSKHCIIIADGKLVQQCTVHERNNVKSGVWDDNGVFIYKTSKHIKYCLPNGETGIIRTFDFPLYLTKVSGSTVYCLNQDSEIFSLPINVTEYLIKSSLLKKDYNNVIGMAKSPQLCGQAIISYLLQKGFPEIALHFIKDEKSRFNLALENGNIQVAFACAKEVDEQDYWCRLAVEALRWGYVSIAEYAYQRGNNFKRLAFLYLLTGNTDKLSKMETVTRGKNDLSSQFNMALYLGVIRERVEILENAEYLPLAYATAAVHGLHHPAKFLAGKLGDDFCSLPQGKSKAVLMPPRPIMHGGDWPFVRVKVFLHNLG